MQLAWAARYKVQGSKVRDKERQEEYESSVGTKVVRYR